jgi:hypothetical protein
MAVKEVGRSEANPQGRPAELGQYDRDLSIQEQGARLEEIHQHLRDQEASLRIRETTTTPMGEQVHWIDLESQVEGGRVADPPSEDEPLTVLREGERELHPLTFDLGYPGAKHGPPGTVPVLKRDLSRIHPRGTLQDFLSKWNRPAPGPFPERDQIIPPLAGSPHEYAYTSHSGTCYGAEGNISAWDPYTAHSDEFSLGQVGMAASSNGGLQTVEAGHQEYRDLYGDWVPHLFVYYTTNGYTSSGDNQGGYNRDVKGWVQYARSIYPGALSSPLSSYGGAQYIMAVKCQLWQGNWWLRVNGNWIGYYPASLFANPGMRNTAGSTAWFGEIVDSGSHNDSTATSMGSGNFPSQGWQYAAFMSNVRYQSDANGGMHDYPPASAWASRSGCYDVESHFGSGGSWGSFFWWGGPGKNPNCP